MKRNKNVSIDVSLCINNGYCVIVLTQCLEFVGIRDEKTICAT